jgi:hypothetical protein
MTMSARVWPAGRDEAKVTAFVDAIKDVPQGVAAESGISDASGGVRDAKTGIPMQRIRHSWEAPAQSPCPLA